MNRHLEVLTGYGANAAKGIVIDHLIRADVGAKDLQAVLEDDRPFSREGNIISAGRRKIPVRISASALKNERAEVVGMLVFLEDITLLRELDEKRCNPVTAGTIIGHSPGMLEVFELLPVLAATDATVLITGETGTGKDLLAETIHRASKRAQHPFIKVNCGAIPENLLESELFGHKRGAFTGAHSDKPGMFRLAHGGTIFLTEIGDLPLQLQVKLLTVLDDREFFPLGSSQKTNVDVRIIAGTHRDLKQLVQENRFREDLFYRLNVLRAHLPPLRERAADIRLLLDHFLNKISANAGKGIKGFTRNACDRLERYDYPGNVRELRNIVEYAVSLCQGDRIDINQLPLHLFTPTHVRTPVQAPTAGRNSNDGADNAVSATEIPAPRTSWTDIEKEKIIAALLKTNGNRTRAAGVLGWGRSTLWRKIKQYGIG